MRKLNPEIKRVEEAVRSLEPEIARVRGHVAGLNPEINAIKGTVSDLQAGIAAATRKNALDRASRKLGQIKETLPRIAGLVGTDSERKTVAEVESTIERSLKASAAARIAQSDGSDKKLPGTLFEHANALRDASGKLAGLIEPESAAARPSANFTPPKTVANSAEQLASEADLLSETTVAAVNVLAFKNALPPPPEPGPREKLEEWTRANAIFFGEEVEYRNPAKAEATLSALARLMGESDLLIRVVGYTDIKGSQNSNIPLSQSRAKKVTDQLVSLGVPEERVVAIGRISTTMISPYVGNNSPNRRVEFEVGFDGESAQ